MPDTPSRTRPTGPRALAALVVAVALGTGAWWAVRRSGDARLAREAAALAPSTLPEPGDPVDDALADLGAELFRRRCSGCHAVAGGARIGPDLAGATRRRSLPWIEAMLLRPDSMTTADPYARALREAYDVPMRVPGSFGPPEARAVVEFLRRADGG